MAGIHTFTAPKAKAKIAATLAGLKKTQMNRDEVQCLLRVSKPTARRYLAHLRSEKLVRIVSWRSSEHGRFCPVYGLGAGPDVPEPAGMTKQERNALQWRRVKADRDTHDRVKASARVQSRIERVRTKPQSWFAALIPKRTALTKEAA